MITIEKLDKRYGEAVAVDDLSFEAPDGELTGLVGANGAGKMTTLRMIAGVLARQPMPCALPARGSLGALLDHTGLYGRLTARENIEYFGQLRRLAYTSVSTR